MGVAALELQRDAVAEFDALLGRMTADEVIAGWRHVIVEVGRRAESYADVGCDSDDADLVNEALAFVTKADRLKPFLSAFEDVRDAGYQILRAKDVLVNAEPSRPASGRKGLRVPPSESRPRLTYSDDQLVAAVGQACRLCGELPGRDASGGVFSRDVAEVLRGGNPFDRNTPPTADRLDANSVGVRLARLVRDGRIIQASKPYEGKRWIVCDRNA